MAATVERLERNITVDKKELRFDKDKTRLPRALHALAMTGGRVSSAMTGWRVSRARVGVFPFFGTKIEKLKNFVKTLAKNVFVAYNKIIEYG